ncbi:MAG: ATP-dependent protease LonB [Nanoarchaeota archaeon]|nr:ATP-dependent protease LonB [Nanoarchaeota archaeon]
MPLEYKTTADIKVSKKIVDQVIGQEAAVKIIKKAALQRRHVFLIGAPGTGKSMLGFALAELLPKEKLVDILSFFNPNDENAPLIRTVPAGQGRKIIAQSKMQGMNGSKNLTILFLIFGLFATLAPYFMWRANVFNLGETANAIIFASSMITAMFLVIGIIMSIRLGNRLGGHSSRAPKIIVENFQKKQAPFFDATGTHAGALLGDVLHDPFQSGGLGTPAHERVVAGMIHKANKGVLFVDEIATLDRTTQQELLSALQERKFSITGQSERSAGAMVRTEPVPCDFVLLAAGNLETVKNMHPALRSRIRGYGYEVFMDETIKDTPENREKMVVFIAQEVNKDKRIPHFDKDAIEEIIKEAQRKANRKGHLTLRLRDLGGLIRAAGDIAKEEDAKLVTKKHVTMAKQSARPLEKQIADKYIERKKEYAVIVTEGKKIGRVNGMAVIGGEDSFSGIILPIEAQVTAGGKKADFVATGKLGDIAKEAVKNVSAIIMRYFGEDIKETYDIYVQFLQTYEGVEGDSASIAIAVAIISSFKNIPVRQDTSMTGSLSVRGEVLPVGGVSSKVEAAIEAGMKQVIVPKSNMQDIIINPDKLKKVKIIPVETIEDVLKITLDWNGKKDVLKKIVGK